MDADYSTIHKLKIKIILKYFKYCCTKKDIHDTVLSYKGGYETILKYNSILQKLAHVYTYVWGESL